LSGELPNQIWVDNAQVIVDAEQKRLDRAQRSLWESQQKTMIWPDGVHQLMRDVPYEGEMSSRARELYRTGYYRQLDKMEKSLRKIDFQTGTGDGVLLLDRQSYTHIPSGTWASQPPVPKEMWEAQIDYWLVKAVFDAVETMNRGAEKITESSIPQVLELTLRGGTRDYSPESAASGAPGEYGGEYGAMGGDSMGGDGLGGGQGTSFNTEIRFDLSAELGPTSGAGAPGTLGGEGYGAPTGGYGAGGGYGEEGGGSEAAGPDRYVDDDEGYPFRTRAFVLGVLMKHDELPKFLSELSGSDWPIQVIRVQMGAVNPDILADVGRTGAPGVPGSRGGYGAGAGRSRFGPGAGAYGAPQGAMETDGDEFGVTGRRRTTVPGVGNNASMAAMQGLIQQTMSDPELAEVWIGGLITLFRPIEEEAEQPQEGYGAPSETNPDDQVSAEDSDSETSTETESPAADGTNDEAQTDEQPSDEPAGDDETVAPEETESAQPTEAEATETDDMPETNGETEDSNNTTDDTSTKTADDGS